MSTSPSHNSRRGSASLASTSSLSDDDDAITPCPLEATSIQPQQHQHQHQHQQPYNSNHRHNRYKCHDSDEGNGTNSCSRPQAARRSSSWRDCHARFDPLDGKGDDSDTELLWRRMLAIQRIFGCYNSARMRAALETGADDGFVPSRTCLDLLNDSIAQLPDEAKRQLEEYLERGGVKRKAKKQYTFVHGPCVTTI